jgi:hypothetical protein
MEIKEIITYNLNLDTNILEVTFRTIEDDEDVQRTDHIDYTLVDEYGYELETESFDFFDDEDDDEKFEKDDIELDEEQLISFLNEYYLINPKSLPKPEIY